MRPEHPTALELKMPCVDSGDAHWSAANTPPACEERGVQVFLGLGSRAPDGWRGKIAG